MKRILVTGGSGKLGRACVKDLLEHGLEVFNADAVPPKRLPLPSDRWIKDREAISSD
jgi:nucleoside-diphosphate-sugar epimerase